MPYIAIATRLVALMKKANNSQESSVLKWHLDEISKEPLKRFVRSGWHDPLELPERFQEFKYDFVFEGVQFRLSGDLNDMEDPYTALLHYRHGCLACVNQTYPDNCLDCYADWLEFKVKLVTGEEPILETFARNQSPA